MGIAKNTESLREWEQIQPQSQQEWEMVGSEDEGISVSPPRKHEGLQISQASVAEEPSSVVEVNKEGEGKGNGNGKQSGMGLEVLRLGIDWLVKRIGCHMVGRGGGLWMSLVVFGALVYSRVRRWRVQQRVPIEKENRRLTLLVKEKDQKISELLLQIAQINEMLSSRGKVPVHRVV